MRTWNEVSFMVCPYEIALCLTPEEVARALRIAGVSSGTFDTQLRSEQAASTECRILDNGRRCCLVIIQDWEQQPLAAVHALLAHEAVHVVQKSFDLIGEDKPASEQLAYAVQRVAQFLMQQFDARSPALVRRAQQTAKHSK